MLSENLARLAQNHFATRHYLLNQVLPAVKKDIESLESYAKELDEELPRYQQWATKYKQVNLYKKYLVYMSNIIIL